jgi:biotin carboxyl carrier protein
MAHRDILAPLAGSVVAVLVEAGQAVRRGEVLLGVAPF